MMMFFFNDTATPEICTLSLHDALPILAAAGLDHAVAFQDPVGVGNGVDGQAEVAGQGRSEEHTSELQSRQYLVCRLLLEKKKHYQLPFCLSIYHFPPSIRIRLLRFSLV